MASLFSAILPDHLKEKLGIRAKERDKTTSVARKALTPSNKTTTPILSTELRAQVQSPGFATRLSNLAREEDLEEKRNLSPRYSTVGSFPKVSFRKKILPKIDQRRSARGSPNVTVRLAPSDPFSPFKRRLSTESQSRDRNATQENNRNIATDPRSVIAMLAELSKKRKVLADDQSETGSKRARRESSSSIGSSLSMEMPPLFSSGVVGQTTSHLVNREADLSLGSLLSRNQNVYDHSSAGIPGSSLSSVGGGTSAGTSAATAGSSTVNQISTSCQPSRDSSSGSGAASSGRGGSTLRRRSSGAAPATKESLRAELIASLSSSRCMVTKRKRVEQDCDNQSDLSDTESETPQAKRSNCFRYPGGSGAGSSKASRQSSRRSSHQSSDGSNSSDSPGKDVSSSTPTKEGSASVLVLPSPADMIRPMQHKATSDKTRKITKEDLEKERKLEKRRLDKLLKAFDDDTTSSDKQESVSTADSSVNKTPVPVTTAQSKSSPTVTTTTTTSSSGGGFAFQIGKPSVGQTQNSAPGFTFDLNKKDGSETEKNGDKNKTDDKNEKIKSTKVTFSVDNTNATDKKDTDTEKKEEQATPAQTNPVAKAPESISGILKKTDESQVSVSATVNLNTFSFSATKEPTSTSEAPKIAPFTFGGNKETFSGTTASSSAAASISTPAAVAASNLPDVAQISSTFKLPVSNSTPGLSSASSLLPTATTTATSAVSSTTTTSAPPPAFGFGLNTIVTSTQASATSTFTFGGTKSGAPTESTTAPAPAFTFGTSSIATAPTTTTPSFNFGSTTAVNSAVTTAASSTNTSTLNFPSVTKSATSSTFQFGGGGSTTQAPAAFQFGATSSSTAAGVAAAPASTAAPPTFQFGSATPAKPATTTSAPSFSFGTPVASKPTTEAFTFGGNSKEGTPAKSSMFQFGAGSTSQQQKVATPASSTGGSSMFQFNSTPASKQSTGQLPKPFAFGEAEGNNKDTNKSSSSVFSFGGAAKTGTENVFGSTIKPAATTTFGAPSTTFGAAPAPATTFGATSAAPPPAFGASNATFGSTSAATVSPFGGAVAGTNAAASSSVGGVFAFGKAPEPAKPTAAASPFNFGGTASGQPQSGVTTGAAPAPSNTGVFSFGGAGQNKQSVQQSGATSSPFQFGGASSSSSSTAPQQPAQPSGAAFQFGAAAPTAAASKPAGFNFGQAAVSPQNAAPGGGAGIFQFGNSSAPQSQPTSAFGAPSPFGVATAQPSAAASPFGGATAPGGFQSPPAPAAGGNMFSIGAGSSQNRPGQPQRKYATARRTRK